MAFPLLGRTLEEWIRGLEVAQDKVEVVVPLQGSEVVLVDHQVLQQVVEGLLLLG